MSDTKVLVFGSFDIIHPGHLALLRQAKSYGDVSVCLALDETIRSVKGRDPLHTLDERSAALARYGVTVYPGSREDRLLVFKNVQPDIVCLGYDQHLFVDNLKAYIVEHNLATKIITVPAFHPELFKSKTIRRAMQDERSGFLLIDKRSGEQSMHTVSALRRLTGIKRIGFAGTLDPLASGLLVCGIGSAVTLIDWWHVFNKVYEAEAEFGSISDTYDSTGTVKKYSSKPVSRDMVEQAMKKFTGMIEQEPPMFSAKKIQGQRMYALARKGKTIERKKHNVTVNDFSLVQFDFPHATVRIECSSGTYVRSLIHDVGQAVGTGAIMTALRRAAMGPFSVSHSDEVSTLTETTWQKKLITVEELRSVMNSYLFS